MGIWLLDSATATAHGGAATLQVTADRVSPGGTLELRGDMQSEGPVELVLVAVAGGPTITLGSVEADPEGHFQVELAVPTELAEGAYIVGARGIDGAASIQVTVFGPTVVGDEGGRQQGQDDVFAGPDAPEPAPDIDPARISLPPPAPSTGSSSSVVMVGMILVVVAATGVALALRRSRPRPRRAELADRMVGSARSDDLS